MSKPVATLTQADTDAIVEEWHARMAKVPSELFANRDVRKRVAIEMLKGKPHATQGVCTGRGEGGPDVRTQQKENG